MLCQQGPRGWQFPCCTSFPTLATSVLNITVCYDVFKASIANEISQETVPKAQEERQMCLVSFPVNLQHLGGDSG